MVKRIKKRIPKKDDPTGEGEEVEVDGDGEDDGEPGSAKGAPKGDAPENLEAEIASIADDRFSHQVAGSYHWAVVHRGKIIGAAAALGLGVFGWWFYARQQRSAAVEVGEGVEAAAVHLLAARELKETNEPSFEPAYALDAAARKARLEQTRTGFGAVRQSNGDRPVGALATLGLAAAEHDLGNLDGALSAYDSLVGRADLPDPYVRAVALVGKAAALEDKGDRAGALASWQQLAALDKERFGLNAGIQEGRILQDLGKRAEARATYERLQKDHATELGAPAGMASKAEITRNLAVLAEAT